MNFLCSVLIAVALAASVSAGGDDPCGRIQAAVIPIIAEFYPETTSYVSQCVAALEDYASEQEISSCRLCISPT